MANTEGNLDKAQVLRLAREVWESQAAADEWLHSRVPALNGHTPFELLDTPEGRRRVSEVLLKIEFGEFS